MEIETRSIDYPDDFPDVETRWFDLQYTTSCYSSPTVNRVSTSITIKIKQGIEILIRICFLALFVTGQFNVFSQNPCEIPGYTFGGNYEGHSYYVSDANATWTESNALAISIGGHLATISSAGENAFVAEVATLSDDPLVWIGLTDEDVEGTFVWVTGEPLIYTNWLPGEPNDLGGEEDHTIIFTYTPDYGKWNDGTGTDYIKYVVEFDTVTCDCNEPLDAGDDNSITVCNDTSPFDLTEELGGNPDPGGTWSPTLASGGNIYDPAIDGSGSFTYTVSSSDCPSDAASVTVTAITCSEPTCEIPGYTFGGNYEGHSYYVSDAITTWTEARALAISIGGHLATISNAGENTFVVGVGALSNDSWDDPPGVWIGLTDEVVEGTFVWVNGEPLIYTNWEPGEPNDWGGAEDYTEIYTSDPQYGNWNDYSDDAWGNYLEYVVEFDTVTCDCNDPLYAGDDNSITVCNDTSPFDLTEELGGNPDPGGTWSPTLASGGNIYDPAIDGSGSFTYTVSSPDCPSDAASVTVAVIVSFTPIISGVPSTICESDNPFTLPTTQDGVTGNWSGTGVNNNNFNPYGLNGMYTLTFTPDVGQCALPATVDILVEPSILIFITGIPDSLCQINSPILLPTTQSGINGNWSGAGVSNNTFNPAGLNGNIVLTFTPDAGICAFPESTSITVFENLYTISGIPASVCVTDPPIPLSPLQDGIIGNWSGPGVSNNTFNPAAQNGMVTLIFIPDGDQCASPVSHNILVNAVVIPFISGLPSSLCETDLPITLLPTEDGYTGSWSGPGVTSNTFNPNGLSGNITLTFTPDAGQCAAPNATNIVVNQVIAPIITGVPFTYCENNFPVNLPIIQNGVNGSWSGPGVSNNIFNPEGQNGITTLTFTPIVGQCALAVQWDITIEPSIVPIISGLPSELCQTDLPINLPIVQNGFTGVWSGPGVTNNTFNPNGWSGLISIFFNPNDGQCADVAEAVILVEAAIIPLLSGVPNMLCETNSPINLLTIQDGIYGNWSGPGVSNNTFNPNNQNGNITLTFIPENGQCAIPVSIAISVSSLIIPIITGVPASLCQSDSSLLLPGLQNGITGIWSGLNVNANSFSPSGLNGNYALTFTPVSGQCADTTILQIGILTPPSFTNLIAACDTIGESYTVAFEITGGDSSTYMVNGMPLNGNIFISPSFLADSTHYAFMLDDANGCGPVEIQGSINCACGTDAGTMNFDGSPLEICFGSDFAVSFNEDANLDQDDLFGFVLHDNAGTQLGTIYAISNDTAFTFPPGIVLGQTYYVSVIAGSNDGTGSINLNDQCLSVAQGIPVIFYQSQAILSGGGEICPSACMTYTFNLAGEKPFELMYQVNANGIVTDYVLLTDTSTVSILICPMDYGLTSGTIDIIPMTLADANCTVPLSSFPGSLTIVQPATESYISNILCPGQLILVNGVIYDQSNPSGTEVMQNAEGCDSIVHISLSYYPAAVFNLNQTLCFGGSITINGTEYNETHPQGMEILPGSAINGCDSVINIQLVFDSVVTADFSSTLCVGESLIINGHTYDELNSTGTEFFPGGSVLGCDSSLHIELLFYPEAASSINPVLCRDEMIIINGVVYDENHPSGMEVLPNASYFGCDSSIQINLSFYSEAIGTITDTLNTGDSIIIQGTVYNLNNPVGTEIIPGGSVAGCDSIIVITLFFRQALSVLIEVIAPVCHGEASGEIVVEDIIGGLAPYTLILDGGSSITATDFPFTLSGLSSGNHQLIVMDATSAELVLELTITEGPVLEVDAGMDLVIPYGEDAEFLATASFPVSTWLWTPDDFLSCADCPDPQIVNPDHNVTYTVMAIDQNGCPTSDEVVIKMVYDNEMYMPTVFSPNGDGVNDTWRIYSDDQKAELVSLSILDRWGGIIYYCADKPLNDTGVEWDGRMKGREMGGGVYVFVAVVKTNDGATRQIKGDITLIR